MNGTDLPARVPGGQILIYRDGALNLQVRLDGQTVWLPQRLIAELYQRDVRTISEHIRNIYSEKELEQSATVRKFRIVQQEGARQVERTVDHHNLRTIGQDYFDELLERIRDIRASERLFYQKITDIYATSIDYDPDEAVTKRFFATVQNKLHWAIHGRTAAEVIAERADASEPHMGLTTWANAPTGPVRRADVAVAKNYLTEPQITELNRIVSMYLDYAEDQARRRRPMHMANWVERLDAFLQFNERDILTHAGSMSHELAVEHAERQFEIYDAERLRLEAAQPSSDFDTVVEHVRELEGRAAIEDEPPSTRGCSNER